MNKNNFSLKDLYSKINYQFNKKKCFLIFLLLFIGVLLPTLSGTESFNFWYKLFNILNNPVYNMLLFVSIGINIIYLAGDMTTNYTIISRYDNLNDIIKSFLKDVVIFTVYLIFVSFVMAIAGAILLSFGDIKMINHPIYNIPIIVYIIFFLLRSIIIASIINSIIFIAYITLRKLLATLIVIINSSFFMVNSASSTTINHFYNMHLIYHNYYTFIKYNSFLLEVIISVLEIIFLVIIASVLYKGVINKKRDLI